VTAKLTFSDAEIWNSLVGNALPQAAQMIQYRQMLALESIAETLAKIERALWQPNPPVVASVGSVDTSGPDPEASWPSPTPVGPALDVIHKDGVAVSRRKREP